MRREYVLLEPEEPADDPDSAEPRDQGEGPKATMGTWGLDERATEMGDQNRQRAIHT